MDFRFRLRWILFSCPAAKISLIHRGQLAPGQFSGTLFVQYTVLICGSIRPLEAGPVFITRCIISGAGNYLVVIFHIFWGYLVLLLFFISCLIAMITQEMLSPTTTDANMIANVFSTVSMI